MTQWYGIDGTPAEVDGQDRGFQYGDGLFETIAVRGGEPRLWSRHMARLSLGCERLGLEGPAEGALRELVDELLANTRVDRHYCIAKIVVSAADQGRGYGRTTPSPVVTRLALFAASPLEHTQYEDGVEIDTCGTRLAVGSAHAGLKTLNRLEQVLGRSEIQSTGVFEGLMLDGDDRLICGTMSNVFLVKDKTLVTPVLERCGVAGVMRAEVLEQCANHDVPVDVRDLVLADLRCADEIFLSNSQFGVLPVSRCGELVWPVGNVTRALRQRLAQSGLGEGSA